MKTLATLAVLAVMGVAIYAACQVGSVYLANEQLREDMKDLSSLTGTRIGLVDPRSPDQLRDRVVAKAAEHGIHLEPAQVNVERAGEGKDGSIYLSTAYDAPVNVFGQSWTVHLTAASPRN